MIITATSHPALTAAFVAIERDNGAHLIGTVYPGTPINLESFTIPEAWVRLMAPAELGLQRLRADSADDFDEFLCGEATAAEALAGRRGDLAEARELLNAWFNAWPAQVR